MKTYGNINDFIMEVFPFEHQNAIKKEKSEITEYIKKASEEFDKKLEAIIKGEKEPAANA